MGSFNAKIEILKHTEESQLISDCYDFVGEIESEFGYKTELLESIFMLFEERPEDDFGVPGPLVHYIEKVEGYEIELLNSLKRKPVFQTLIMTKRCFNASSQSSDLQRIFEEICNDPNTDPEVKSMINNIFFD